MVLGRGRGCRTYRSTVVARPHSRATDRIGRRVGACRHGRDRMAMGFRTAKNSVELKVDAYQELLRGCDAKFHRTLGSEPGTDSRDASVRGKLGRDYTLQPPQTR